MQGPKFCNPRNIGLFFFGTDYNPICLTILKHSISQVSNPTAYISFFHSQAKTGQTNKTTEHSGPNTHSNKGAIKYLDP